MTNNTTSCVEKALSLKIRKKYITIFYKVLISNSPHTSQSTKQAWEKDLGVTIGEAEWRKIWCQAMNISVSNYTKSIQFKIVHRKHITPFIKNKMDATNSPLCWKCLKV